MDLPADVILTIISKLPIKDLCRCKALSTFFSSPEALTLIDQRRPKPPFEWLVETQMDVVNDDLSEEEEEDGEELTVNDDLSAEEDGEELTTKLLYHYSMDYAGAATMTLVAVGEANEHLRFHDGVAMISDGDQILVCDLTNEEDDVCYPRWCEGFDFCFDPSSRTYKVLGWRRSHNEEELEFRLLTLEGDCLWEPVTNEFGIFVLPESCIAVGGKLIWKFDAQQLITLFNTEAPQFFDVQLPIELTQLKKEDFGFSIFDLEDCLGLVEQRVGEASFNLWILKDFMNMNNRFIPIRRNISLPFLETTMTKFHSNPGKTWKITRSNFSYRNGEIIIVVNNEVTSYVFLYSLVSGQITTILPSQTLFPGFVVNNFVANTDEWGLFSN